MFDFSTYVPTLPVKRSTLIDSTTTGRPCVCIMRGVVSCPIEGLRQSTTFKISTLIFKSDIKPKQKDKQNPKYLLMWLTTKRY